MSYPGLTTCLAKEFKELRNLSLIISRLYDILLLSFPVKFNMDVLKIGIGCKNFRRILGGREILSKILGDFMRI